MVRRSWFECQLCPLVSPATLAKAQADWGFLLLQSRNHFLPCRLGWGSFRLPFPPKGTSVFVIITKMIVTENQVQGFCPEVSGPGQGSARAGAGQVV